MSIPSVTAAVDTLHLFGDATRVRLLSLLAHEELTVHELGTIMELAQPRVSTHLAKLREAAVVRDRRAGGSTFYALSEGTMPPAARHLWALLSREVSDEVIAADRTRCDALVRARSQSGAWTDAVAGQMDRHYSPGRTWESLARGLLGLIQAGDVLDAGAGDGAVAELIAPRAASVTCLDREPRVIAAAEKRLASLPNVRVVSGDLLAMPFEEASFDHVLFLNALTCVADPARAVAECGRVLRHGGGLTLVTLRSHRHPDVTAAYGHVHAGFSEPLLRRMVADAGLVVDRCAVTSRERRSPRFEVVSLFARKGSAPPSRSDPAPATKKHRSSPPPKRKKAG
jgi:SAM-dependent methyltransferase